MINPMKTKAEYKNSFLKILKGDVYSDCSKDSYEISILICTYRPNINHLLIAIHSVLLQNNVDYQIVITDDGSEHFDVEAIIYFFEKRNFHEFVICRLDKNGGTVKNFRNGLRYCRGEYLRALTPEDYIYGQDTLRDWIDFIRAQNASVSFSNVICYRLEGNELVPVRRKANPQVINNFYMGIWGYEYLIFDDICVGTGMLVKKEIINRYIEYLNGKVIFAEDNAYRLMAYNREKMVFYNNPTVLYEVGNGISTSKSVFWAEKLRNDWEATDSIILNWNNPNSILRDSFIAMKKIKRMGKLKRRIFKLFFPGYIKHLFRTKMNVRYTETEIDYSYIEKLLTT